MNKRDLKFDVLRISACLMVMAMHSPIPYTGGGENGLFLCTLSYFTSPCIGLFFIISGALLLPVKTSTGIFLKKRFTKILIPTFVWSLFYILWNMLIEGDNVDLLKSVLSLPFSAQGNPTLWFMYTLMGLYLLAPILSRWLNGANRKELDFYLAVWAVSLCYPIVSLVADVNTGNTGVLYYFTGYAGYFVLGFYLRQHPESFSFKLMTPAVAVAVAVPVMCKLMHWEVNFYDLFWYLSVFVAVQCIFWYRITERFCPACFYKVTVRNIITRLSNLSFGMYLIHIFFMRRVLWHCGFILSINSYILQTLTVTLMTFAISAALCHVISFLPKAQYIIGYKHKKPGA